MIMKLKKDHVSVVTPFCGELLEILSGPEFSPNIAIALDIRATTAHYHTGFEEVYFVLDGNLVLQLYDPASGESTEQRLEANELCVIAKGVHHKITQSSGKNRLCVLTIPRFDAGDEHPSTVI
jgi:mannose-6-phosphate isomerase-like protein (cupin superfamily)